MVPRMLAVAVATPDRGTLPWVAGVQASVFDRVCGRMVYGPDHGRGSAIPRRAPVELAVDAAGQVAVRIVAGETADGAYSDFHALRSDALAHTARWLRAADDLQPLERLAQDALLGATAWAYRSLLDTTDRYAACIVTSNRRAIEVTASAILDRGLLAGDVLAEATATAGFATIDGGVWTRTRQTHGRRTARTRPTSTPSSAASAAGHRCLPCIRRRPDRPAGPDQRASGPTHPDQRARQPAYTWGSVGRVDRPESHRPDGRGEVPRRVRAVSIFVAICLVLTASGGVASGAEDPDQPVFVSPETDPNPDLAAIAEARGWTIEEAAAQQAAADAVGKVAEVVAREHPEVFIGSTLATRPGGSPTLYVKGPAGSWLVDLVATAPVKITIADKQPYSLLELEVRAEKVHHAAEDQGYLNIVTRVNITGGGVIPVTVALQDGLSARAEDVLAGLPADLRSSVVVDFADPSGFRDTTSFGGMWMRENGSNCARAGSPSTTSTTIRRRASRRLATARR